MKSFFPGHYSLSKEEVASLWGSATFIVDANVLLHFYRYSPATKQALYDVLSSFKKRLWIPYQVAEEFHRNRLDVISRQTKAYEEAEVSATALLEILQSSRKHPFIASDLLTRSEAVLTELAEELKSRCSVHEKLLHDDPTLLQIAELFDQRVGAEPTPEEQKELVDEAKRRVDGKIPPGYKEKKDEGKNLGDAILWMQVLRFASQQATSVIFVTDDAKEDWWTIVRGQVIGPRPEMIKEFKSRTKLPFHMYSPARFLEYATDYLAMKADATVIQEATDVTTERSLRKRKHSRKPRFHEELEHLLRIASHVERHISEVQDFIRAVEAIPNSVWEHMTTPLELQPKLMAAAADAYARCRCIGSISDDLNQIQPVTLNTYIGDLSRYVEEHVLEAIVNLTRVPGNVFVMIRNWMEKREQT